MSSLPARSTPAVLVDRVLFAAVVLVSFVILFAPSAPSPPLFTNADKVIHAGLFAALAWSAQRAWRRERAVGMALVAYAAASEVIQATVLSQRSGSWTDALADVTGIAIGLLLARLSARSGRLAQGDRGRS